MRVKLLRFHLARFRLDRTMSQRRFSITEAAVLLLTAYLASRGLGIVRQSMFNALFGTGAQANAYYAAAQLPYTLFDLIAGGALTYALIPVFLSYEQENGRQEAWRLVSLVFNVMLVLLTALVLLGEWIAPAFVNTFLVPGYAPAEQALVTTLTRIMLVQPLLLGVGTVATAILSSKRQFLLPALSIAVYNFGMIGGLLVSLAIPAVGVYGPTYGVLAAAGCQYLVQAPGLMKEGFRYSFVWDLKNKGLHEVMRLLGPNALAVVISSIGAVLSTAYISYLPDQASLSALHNGQMLFSSVVILLAQAVGQAAIPRMSHLAARAQYVHLRLLILRVTGILILIGVPCTLALAVLGKPVIALLFQHGAFSNHSGDLTTLALLGYALGLPGSLVYELFVRGFYSLKDARTPLLIDMIGLALQYGMMLLFLKIMMGPYALLAIPLAASISITIKVPLLGIWLFTRLQKRVQVDKGLERLKRMRARSGRQQEEQEGGEQEALEVEVK